MFHQFISCRSVIYTMSVKVFPFSQGVGQFHLLEPLWQDLCGQEVHLYIHLRPLHPICHLTDGAEISLHRSGSKVCVLLCPRHKSRRNAGQLKEPIDTLTLTHIFGLLECIRQIFWRMWKLYLYFDLF